MMSCTTLTTIAGLVVLAIDVSATIAQAAEVTPLYENDHVKAVEYAVLPNQKTDMNARPPYVLFALTPFTAIATSDDENQIVWKPRFEDVRWLEHALRTFDNTGSDIAKFIAVEIRKPASNGRFIVASDDGTNIAPQQYTVLFENDRVRVIRVRVRPGEKTLMHSHPGSAFRCGLQQRDRRSRFTFADGTTREQENKGRGEARWSAAPSRHIIENIGANDIHNLLIELK